MKTVKAIHKDTPYKAKFEQYKKFHQAAKKEIRKKETEIRHLEKDLKGLRKDHDTIRIVAIKIIIHALSSDGGILKYNHLYYIQREIYAELLEIVGDEMMAIYKEKNKGKIKLMHNIKNYDKARQEQAEAMEAVSQWKNIMKYL